MRHASMHLNKLKLYIWFFQFFHHQILTKSLLQIDTSNVGCVDVLQEGEDDVYHSVAYFSKTFSKCQRNYSTVEKNVCLCC